MQINLANVVILSFIQYSCFYDLQSMRSNLSSVLKDQNLLYLFHSFLKAEEAINILSFCLAVGKLHGDVSPLI